MHNLTNEEYEKLILEHSDFKHDIDTLKDRLQKYENQQEVMTSLTRSVDRLTLTMGNMVDEQKELKEDVKALKEAPIENFNHYKKTVVSCVITTVIGAVLGAIISLVILKVKGG